MAYTLLIADDEQEIRKGLCTCFPWEQLGFKLIAQAENGRAVLDVVAQKKVDVILCDICMPVMSGLETAKEVYRRKLETIFVLYTAFRDFDYAQEALSYGVRYYLLKSTPYREMIDFFETLKKTLDEQRATQADRPFSIAEASGYYPGILTAIKQYIDDNLAGATLEGAAAAIGKSTSFTSKFFHQQEKLSFGDYLQSRRMEQAIILLRDYSLKTYEISEIVGYATPKSFSRTFRQYYGISPQEFRRGVQSVEMEAKA